ncbi:glycoside hydrolase family 2 protein [Apiospora kogelbergensis]|uniref:Glycoside hydrolase family 2 protein n=1 Tax=Apiospora kogelbergensis TaxID=1337665 RepID=A0AAW0QR20_9PEZI
MWLLNPLLCLWFGTSADAIKRSPYPTLQPSPRPSSFVVPTWDIQASPQDGKALARLSLPGANVTDWHHISTSRCTLMGCLLHAGVYDDSELFFSENLKSFDRSQFAVPWLYRNEFRLDPRPGQHYFLKTNGITSKADILLNGHTVTTKDFQVGSYAGHEYEITELLNQGANGLLIQVYPTDYYYDFALGFVDWNPYPPDNGTGVWRNVVIKQTGPVALDPLRVVTNFELPAGTGAANVTLKATARNLENRTLTFAAQSTILAKSGGAPMVNTQSVTLGPYQSADVAMTTNIIRPSIWWPNAWGGQPLYNGKLSISTTNDTASNRTISDSVEQEFGIRKVTSSVNAHNDTVFSINGHPFQVIGGGYSSDMFLRWDTSKFEMQAKYMLDLGHNTVRLEGKMEHPELYEVADRLGLMVLPGWECCDKWEAWKYNDDLAVKSDWLAHDYGIANASMRHEATMLQSHPSLLGFLVGSDYWPDDAATSIYMEAFKSADWQNPIVASASKRSYPAALGPGGMKMDGPYDWVPPNYWYDVEPSQDRLGAAFGFGSELGAGVGTPELGSLKKFLDKEDLDDLWKQPEKGLYHMSTNVSSFYDRKIYNDALWKRMGAPTSLDNYLLKAQIMDYEATRAQFESVSAFWNKNRPATGLIYWMLNNAWPSLHWNLFDYYMRPAGSYYGAKTGTRMEHVAFNYLTKELYLINRSIDRRGPRTVHVDIVGLQGEKLASTTVRALTEPNKSKSIHKFAPLKKTTDVDFLRVVLTDEKGQTLSRNVYWIAKTIDQLDWENSDWFYTPVSKFADYNALDKLQPAQVTTTITPTKIGLNGSEGHEVLLENQSGVPAFFVALNLLDRAGGDVLPVFWSDNYVTLLPHEKLHLSVTSPRTGAAAVQLRGKNVAAVTVALK